MPKLPANIVVKRILVTDLSQQLKKQRDFLKWMTRRHKNINPDQSEAFATGARLLEELRQDLLDGLFDAEEVKEVFTSNLFAGMTPAARAASQEELDIRARANAQYNEDRRANAGKPGYTYDGRIKCGDAWCEKAEGHEGAHSND